MKPQEVADILGAPSTAIRQLMVRMARDGDIQKISYGIYASTNYIEISNDDKADEIACHTDHSVTVEEETKEASGLQDNETVTGKKKSVTLPERKKKLKKQEKKTDKTKGKTYK